MTKETISFEQHLMMVLKKRILAILLIAFLIGGGIFAYKEMRSTDRYVAKVSIAVSAGDAQKSTWDDIQKNASLVDFYCRLATSSVTLNRSIERTNSSLSEQALRDMVKVTGDNEGQFVDIEVRDGNPDTARELAIAIAESLDEEGEAIRGEDILTTTTYPDDILIHERPQNMKYAVAGFVGAFIIALFIFYMVDEQNE